MARSIKKGPFVDSHLMKKVEEARRTKEAKAVSYTHLTLPTTPYV